MARNSLSNLAYIHPTLIVNSTLLSRLVPLTDLVWIFTGIGCLIRGTTCRSRFTDQDVEALAVALPRLEYLTVGEWPCYANTCPTTVLSLLSLSVHCTSLKHLNIRFRTMNLPVDVIAMLDYACSYDLYQRPKYVLETLVTGDQIPVFGDNELVVSMGMATILPSLERFKRLTRWTVITEDFRLRMENAVENLWVLGALPNLLLFH